MKKINTLIIGASAAGLACAATLQKDKIEYIILEKQKHVGHSWRNHYDRLHLHTNKSSSALPFVKFPKTYPTYASRDQFVDYLEKYKETLENQPLFNTDVKKCSKSNGKWIVESNNGDFEANHLIVCTGNTNVPHFISKPGIEGYNGVIIHSSEYKNGSPFKDKNVLVIGFGNSACEIAICLHEHGAIPSMSVRSAVNVIPRDILGIPVLAIGIVMGILPPKVADKLNQPLINLLVGNIEKLGLKKLPYGPNEQIVKYHKIPLLDIGTMDLIKKGKIEIFDDIKSIEGKVVHFENGKSKEYDAIIMATGYETGLDNFIDINENREQDIQLQIKDRVAFGEGNLFFCGFYVSPTGMIREMSIEAKAIAKEIKKRIGNQK